jgi:hypothetical protein
MDKLTFIEKAPTFYSVAIAYSIMEAKREVFTMSQIRGEVPALSQKMPHDPLMSAGLRLLVEAGVIGIVKEAFGPQLYRRFPAMTKEWADGESGDQIPIFRTFSQVRNWA